MSKPKAYADCNLNVGHQTMEFVFDEIENIVGKGEIVGYQQFLLFPVFFQKPSLLELLKVRIMW